MISEKVTSENWNRPHNGGLINPANFSPYPKNPVIASFFKEIGRADELGSGVRNIFKYCSQYTKGTNPVLIEDDIFRIVIPLTPAATSKSYVESRVPESSRKDPLEKLGENQLAILEMIYKNPSVNIKEMSRVLEISTTAVENNIRKLKSKGVLVRKGPAKKGIWLILS